MIQFVVVTKMNLTARKQFVEGFLKKKLVKTVLKMTFSVCVIGTQIMLYARIDNVQIH